MNHYPHHIGDFDTATRHLTRVERSLYRDLMDLYYAHEKPLPGDDFEYLAKRVLAVESDEKAALRAVLNEFFTLEDGRYHNSRCDREIARYQRLIASASNAGKASAEKRMNGKATVVQRSLKPRSTNQNQNQNQEKTKASAFALPAWVPLENWQGFVEMRTKSKTAFTERAKALLVSELHKLVDAGGNAAEILDQSTANGWKGVFPLKVNGNATQAADWMRSDEGTLRRGENLGVKPRPGEDMRNFRERVRVANENAPKF